MGLVTEPRGEGKLKGSGPTIRPKSLTVGGGKRTRRMSETNDPSCGRKTATNKQGWDSQEELREGCDLIVGERQPQQVQSWAADHHKFTMHRKNNTTRGKRGH